MEELTGKQKETLYNALFGAFPKRGLLAQMVTFKMDESLEKVAGAESYSDVILNLIEWAESQGLLEKLIVSARAQNPGNRSLQAFAVEVGIEPPPKQSKRAERRQNQENDSIASFGLETLFQARDVYAVDIERLGILYQRAYQASQAVCRIEAYQSMSTGFLVAPDIVLTLYHSIKSFMTFDPATNQRTPCRWPLIPVFVLVSRERATLRSAAKSTRWRQTGTSLPARLTNWISHCYVSTALRATIFLRAKETLKEDG